MLVLHTKVRRAAGQESQRRRTRPRLRPSGDEGNSKILRDDDVQQRKECRAWTTSVTFLAVIFAAAFVFDVRGTLHIKPSPVSTTSHPSSLFNGTFGNNSLGVLVPGNEENNGQLNAQEHLLTTSSKPSETRMIDEKENIVDRGDPQKHLPLHSSSSSPSSSSELEDNGFKLLTRQWKQYQKDLYELTTPNASLTTGAFTALQLTNGYRNQATIFCLVIMDAMDNNISQILLPSLQWKDYLGTNTSVWHEDLFDVVHWNSFYPSLPRLVRWDPAQHPHIQVNTSLYGQEPSLSFDNYFFGQNQDLGEGTTSSSPVAWAENTPKRNEHRHPRTVGPKHHFLMHLARYNKYVQEVASGRRSSFHPADVLIMRQSSPDRPFRPHPVLRYMINERMTIGNNKGQKTTIQENGNAPPSFHDSNISRKDTEPSPTYLALHARVEPDMQRHPKCQSIKVRLLEEMIETIYKTFPDAPCDVSGVVLVLSRKLLEDEVRAIGTNSTSGSVERDGLAGRNLDFLNHLAKEGMWNGTIPVLEGGMNVFRQEGGRRHVLPETSVVGEASPKKTLLLEKLKSFYRSKPLIVGAIVDFSLSIEARWFLGTEVSTFSRDIFAARLFDDNEMKGDGSHCRKGEEESTHYKNYKYLPHADLQPVTEVFHFNC